MADPNKTPRELSAEILPATFLSRAALVARGLRSRDITRLVAGGEIIRLRNGRYVGCDLQPALVRAGKLGARLDCVSLLSALGVFVHTHDGLHVQIEKGATRLPIPDADVVRHWRRSCRGPRHLAADIVEALAQSFRCQPLREAIATLDSAWHHGLVDEAAVAAVFELLPRRYRPLRRLLDKRSESGPETIMRLILLGLGCDIQLQVNIPGVGRVDFVVDGWLIIECDSREHHAGWENEKRDRRRDLVAATQGYTTVRPIAEDILYHREEIIVMLRQVLAHPPIRPRGQNSSRTRRTARKSAGSAPARATLTES